MRVLTGSVTNYLQADLRRIDDLHVQFGALSFQLFAELRQSFNFEADVIERVPLGWHSRRIRLRRETHFAAREIRSIGEFDSAKGLYIPALEGFRIRRVKMKMMEGCRDAGAPRTPR